jgi:hypothetical protein
MAQRKKWYPVRMKEAMRNKEVGGYKASRVFNIPQTTLEHCIKHQEKCLKQSKLNWIGSKFLLVKQKMICLSTLF